MNKYKERARTAQWQRKQRKRGRKSQYPLPRAPASPPVQYTGMMVPAPGMPQTPHAASAAWPGPNPQAFLGMSSVAAVSPHLSSPMMPMMPQYPQHATSPHMPGMASVSSLGVPGMVPNAAGSPGAVYGYPPNQQNRVWLMPNQQQQPQQQQAQPQAQHVQGHMRYPIMMQPRQGASHQGAQAQVPPEYGYIPAEARSDSFKPRAIEVKESRLDLWQRRRVEALIKLNAKQLNRSALELKKSRGGKAAEQVKGTLGKVVQLLHLQGSSQAENFVQSWMSSVTGESVAPPAVAASPMELSVDSSVTLESKFNEASFCAVGISANWSKDIPALFVSYETEGQGQRVTGLKLHGNSSFHSAFAINPSLYSELLPAFGADLLAVIFNSGDELVEYVLTAETKLSLSGREVSKEKEKERERRFTCMHIFDCLWRSDVHVAPKPFKTLVRCGFLRQTKEGGKTSFEAIISFERVDGGGPRLAKRSKVSARAAESSPAGSKKSEENEWERHAFEYRYSMDYRTV